MGKLFDYDGGIMRVLNKLVDCVFLSVLWIVFSIPILTFGASTTALYYTANKVIRHDRSSVLREFWRAFKKNFVQATIIWLILAVFGTIAIANCMLFYGRNKALFILYVVIVCVATMWGLQVFAQIARFENKLIAIMKNSALMSIRHFFRTVLVLVVFAACLVLVGMWPILIIILPALFMAAASFILESIYEHYMSPEDLALEKERNGEY